MMIARRAWVWLAISCWPAAQAQSPGCCTHQGGLVVCPPGLPAGSRSLEFVPQGTLWGTPTGQTVMVPSTSFARCPQPGSQTPPAAAAPPPAAPSPPVATPRPPPPPVASTPKAPPAPPVTAAPPAPPPSTPASPPAATAAPSGVQPPPTAATVRERDRDRDRERERARTGPVVRIPGTPPAGPPLVAVPVAPPGEEGKEADAAIGRMGALLRAQEKETQEKEAGGTTCARPAPGKGGSGLAIAKGDSCDCEDPRVLKQEAPAGKGKGKGGGAPKAPARAAAFRLEMHLVPHWRTVEAGKTHRLGTGDRAQVGTVSGETLFGGIAGMSATCKVTTAGCRGDCEKVVYDSVHVDLDINIAYVAGRRAQAAHESVHARQIGDVFRKALEGIEQTGAYPCSPPKDTPRRLQLCRERLELEVREAGVAAVQAWYARRLRLQNTGRYFNDPEEIEAFAEENKGDAAAVFAPGVEPPAEFASPAPPAAPASR